jgi:ADP-L-glycero-D-manno-heptose 6-epimerase
MSYIITWWAGFIGSILVWYLNQKWINNIIIVDHLDTTEKWKNLLGKKYTNYFDKSEFFHKINEEWYISKNDIVVHLWACSATTESDTQYLMENNTKYSRALYEKCTLVWAQFIYASSAATYGNWKKWYLDDYFDLHPLNMYWYSKHIFDQRILDWTKNFTSCTSQVVGLKFFNVYGPNEYHKGNMASVVYHWFHQIKNEWKIELFKSYKEWFTDGEQQRDFIYVKDVIKVIYFFMTHSKENWIFNLWTGIARSFNDLAKATFDALDIPAKIFYKEMPESLKTKYQYFTQANMEKLQKIWYEEQFFSLEEWVKDYIQNYLNTEHLIC